MSGLSVQTQGKHWMLTIPGTRWSPRLPENCQYIRGQRELGEGGFDHWQVYVVFSRKQRLSGVKKVFPPETHAELTRSEAAREYVWKEDTRVAGTQFEYGSIN